ISMVDRNSIFFFPRSLFSLHSFPSDLRASLVLPLLYHSSNYLGREFYIGDHLSFGPRQVLFHHLHGSSSIGGRPHRSRPLSCPLSPHRILVAIESIESSVA